ncbi:uncharacterized protein LOC120547180 [Perca fluviatilis]|uniref:uncharacterized protein LOC120547180 n=1 Tax=Perca fluviatilis TaxID=8168 RepID=UPI0019622DBC|nr:uncharacterized protein LOC120547180 [Perca fluviatilis]
MDKRHPAKKRNFTEVEIETLTSQVEANRLVLFGSLKSGIKGSRKNATWTQVTAAVNSVSAAFSGVDSRVPPTDPRRSHLSLSKPVLRFTVVRVRVCTLLNLCSCSVWGFASSVIKLTTHTIIPLSALPLCTPAGHLQSSPVFEPWIHSSSLLDHCFSCPAIFSIPLCYIQSAGSAIWSPPHGSLLHPASAPAPSCPLFDSPVPPNPSTSSSAPLGTGFSALPCRPIPSESIVILPQQAPQNL